jgi:hypothetical protein
MGAYPVGATNPFAEWYQHGTNGQTTLTIPQRFGNGGVRTPGFIGHPARAEAVRGKIQGQELVQYDFTPQQYEALAKLTATLCTVLPRIECKYPTDAAGKLIPGKLPDDVLTNYHGVLGHYHLTTAKVDPGPAFNWEYVIGTARQMMTNALPPRPRALGKGR